VAEAVQKAGADVSIIFVPAAFAADAIMEAADAGIKVIVCITEGIPVKDMIYAKEYLKGKACRLIGPNCPGVITAGEAKVGIMPGFVFKKGKIGIVSKSGTLTYEAADQIVKAGMGITTAIGIGGDPIPGTNFIDVLALFEKDPQTEVTIDVAKQEIRFGGQSVPATFRETARDALVNGRWDAIGELLDGIPAVKETAKKLPYLAA
jgi:succinyl-CoA synthetase alpha subunit